MNVFTKDEYKSLIDDVKQKIEKNFADDLFGLILVGSVASGKHIPGESDCNLVMVMKDSTPEHEFAVMQKLSKLQAKYLDDPLFASMFDLHVYFEKEIPTSAEENKFNWVHALNAKEGKVLMGENPFASLDIPEELVRLSAQGMMQSNMEALKDLLLLSQQEDELDTAFIAVDTVLRCATAFLYANGHTGVNKGVTPDVFTENFKDLVDPELLHRAHRIRLGSKEETIDGFVEQALEFCLNLTKAR